MAKRAGRKRTPKHNATEEKDRRNAGRRLPPKQKGSLRQRGLKMSLS